MFILAAVLRVQDVFSAHEKRDFLFINKQTVYPVPADPEHVFGFMVQSPRGWSGHTNARPSLASVA